jgi:hypothetical protein
VDVRAWTPDEHVEHRTRISFRGLRPVGAGRRSPERCNDDATWRRISAALPVTMTATKLQLQIGADRASTGTCFLVDDARLYTVH